MKTTLKEFTVSHQNYLRKFANFMRAKFGSTVYLYGECLKDQEEDQEPSEWSVRVEVPEPDFLRMFGDPELWEKEMDSGFFDIHWRVSDVCHQQKQFGHKMTFLNIDFGVFPKGYAHRRFRDEPKIKIDTRED